MYQNDPRNMTSEKRNVVKIFKHFLYNETSLVADLCLLKVCEINYCLTKSFLIFILINLIKWTESLV